MNPPCKLNIKKKSSNPLNCWAMFRVRLPEHFEAIEVTKSIKQDDPDHIDKWIEKLLLKTKPEGILALPPLSLNRRFVDKLIEAKIPVVNIGGISVNDKQGAVTINDKLAPTAIFASNDEMAAGVMVAAHNLGIDVPNQLSVAGFDDNFFITSLWPGLTTIRQPLEGFGRTAIEILISIRGNPDNVNSGEQKCLGYELIERDSVADLNPGVAGEK